jgi:outer membrane protein OmpA-like peptidoglycan-associated protein
MSAIRRVSLLAAVATALLAGCVTVPPGPPPDVVRLQSDLDRLHGDPRIDPNGGTELANADAAVDVLARNARTLDARAYGQGVYIAGKLIDIAEASALARYAEERGRELGLERDRMLGQAGAIADAPRPMDRSVPPPPPPAVRTESGVVPADRAELMAMQDEMTGVESHLDARGLVVRLNDAMFEPGRSALTPTAEQSLDGVARVLRGDSDAHIAIEAHGDDRISSARAAYVRDYLDARGVADARLRAQTLAYAGDVSYVDIVIRGDAR